MTNFFVNLWFLGEVAVAVVIFRLLQPRIGRPWRHVLLIAISLFFLTRLEGADQFVPLAIGYAILFALFALAVHRYRGSGSIKFLLLAAIASAVLIMLLFKYPFYSRSLFGDWEFIATLGTLPWIGLSYMTFRAMDLVLYARSRRAKKLGFLQAVFYLLFFLPFIAGPINRYGELVRDQEKGLTPLDASTVRDVVLRSSIGVIKIILISRLFFYYAIINDPTPVAEMSWLEITLGLYAYFLYIYVDFSGYCDVAIAVARLFGIRVPENFNFPFLAVNLQDFWNRWHISLSHWCRDHIFFGLMRYLGINHKWLPLVMAAAFSTFVTFFFIGAWHGDAAHWVLYGCYHGAGFATWVFYNRGMGTVFPEGYNALCANPVYRAASIFLTFNFVAWGLLLTLGLESTGIVLGRLLS